MLYGGAAGGGKSFLMRRLRHRVVRATSRGCRSTCSAAPAATSRRTTWRARRAFARCSAAFVAAGKCEIVADEIRFSNGARIYLCHCKDEKDIYKYQGAEIHVLLIDELTHFTEDHVPLPAQPRAHGRHHAAGAATRAAFRASCAARTPAISGTCGSSAPSSRAACRSRSSTMPRGRRRHAAPVHSGAARGQSEHGAGRSGLRGAARRARLARAGAGDALGRLGRARRARSSIAGRTAATWWTPFGLPDHWPRFRSGDWGSYAPFSFGWWAVVPDHYKTAGGIWLPRGCLVRYREYYGMQPGRPNVGLKLPAEQVGARLAELERDDPKIANGVLDPSAFRSDGGPTIAQRLTAGSGGKIFFRPADNTRVPGRGAMGGWDQVRARLVGDADGRAMMVFFSTCHDTIRTLPALQHDTARPEDVDTSGEDHAADEIRYACMSRPWVPPAKAAPEKPRDRWERF